MAQTTAIAQEFSTKDLTEVSRIIRNTHAIYTEQLSDATFRLHQAQRNVNRAAHEQHRLEKHLQRIEDFCTKHNITLQGEEKEQ